MFRNRFLRALSLAVLAAATLLFFRNLAFTNLILPRGDTFYYFYPYWEQRARALLAGEIPLWNPYLFMGVPFLANPQAGVLYPLNWPLIGFAAPIAVKAAILVHTWIAGLGTFSLARRLKLSTMAAILAGLLFALGGHLTAKVEQVNQLQGLAWLPWLFLAWDLLLRGKNPVGAGLAMSVLLALQLTAGHTQTTFITMIGLIVWWLAAPVRRTRNNILLPVAFITLGILLSAAQLLPTLELSQNSLRSGGLSFSEAVSFSLNPLLIGRALLPGYSRAIFSEFVAYVGVIALGFVVVAMCSFGRRLESGDFRLWRAVAVLGLIGLFFALGGFNPIYWVLVRFVPGFNLFRAPARWLVLWALGAALLAGRGLDSLANLDAGLRRQAALITGGIVAALLGLAIGSARLVPPGEAGPLGFPAFIDFGGWLAALAIFTLAIGLRNWQRLQPLTVNLRSFLLVCIAIVELLFSSQRLPLNNLTAPEAYSSVRPAMTQLLAAREDSLPAGRFLSMSALLFDPGDLAAIRSILEPHLPEEAVFDSIVAAKAKEVLAPNLPLAWEVPAVDGYDGGVLPLLAYAQFAKGFTGERSSPDGRLREYVTETPPNWLLNITNTRWLITDKVDDVWIADVYYDLQIEIPLVLGERTEIRHVPEFSATALGLVIAAHTEASLLGHVIGELDYGESLQLPISNSISESGLAMVPFGDIVRLTKLSIEANVAEFVLRGAALIDERTGAFLPLTLGPYRLAHSGDVKIYENLNVFPRAYLVHDLPLVQSTEPIGTARIETYSPTQVEISTSAAEDALLVLADSAYPGWQATLDGVPTDIDTANGLFRVVRVPSGEHTVEYKFESQSWRWGGWLSSAGIGVWILLLVWSTRTRRRMGARAQSEAGLQ